jgi:hypothetical protein
VTLADVAPSSSTPFGPLVLLCGGLVCLFLISGIALSVVLYQRSRRKPPGDVA